MACNTPIIAAFDTESELAEILSTSGAGVCIEPENTEKLADAILTAESEHSKVKSHNSREYVETYASKQVCVAKYVKTIKGCF